MRPSYTPRRILSTLAAIVLIGTLIASSASGAINTTYGDIVDSRFSASEPNTVFFLSGFSEDVDLIKATPDIDGEDLHWYIDFDADNLVNSGDLRLSQVASGSGTGTWVRSGDGDVGHDLSVVSDLCYVETFNVDDSENDTQFRGAGSFNPPFNPSGYNQAGEPLFVLEDANCTGTSPFSEGDQRITATPSGNPSGMGGGSAGSRVTSSHASSLNDFVTDGFGEIAELASGTDAFIRIVDLDHSGGKSIGDAVYLSIRGDGNAEHPLPGDVRLFSWGGFSYGSYVEAHNHDAHKALEDLPGALHHEGDATEFCDGTTLQWSLYFSVGAANTEVKHGDLRLAAKSGAGSGVTAGKAVRAGDTDEGRTLNSTLGGKSLHYWDKNNNAIFDHDDVLYLSTSDSLETGDVRLSTGGSKGAGTCVASGDSDRNQNLESIGENFMFVDAWNAGGYQAGQPVYFVNDPLTADAVDIGDLRVGGDWSTFGSFGSFVGDTSSDRVHQLRAGTLNPALCFVASESSYRPGDPVYFTMRAGDCTGSVRVGDVRISGTGTENAGTQVASGDHDFNMPLEALGSAKLSWSIGGASGFYDPDDNIYIDVDGGDTVNVGDVRVSRVDSHSAGSKVASGASDQGNSLTDLGLTLANIKFLKALPTSGTTFSEGYTGHDVVVYDLNANNHADQGDIFLTGSGGTSSLTESGGGGRDSPSTPSTNPTASFSTSVDGRFVVTDGQGSSAISGRSISNYVWNFGDGTTEEGSDLSQATHTYEEEGEYTIRLTVTDNQGDSGTTTRTIQTDDYVPPTDTESPTDTEEPTDTTDPDDTGTEPEDEEEPTPGPAVVVILVAIGAALVSIRRRR